MKIYLARHAEYASTLEGELNEEGISHVHALVKWLKPLNLSIANIYHSGLLRAEQTAQLLAQGFISSEPPLFKQGLTPVDDVTIFLQEISVEEKDILVVGHLPFLSKLVSKMIINDEHKEVVAFHPATLVCMEQIELDRWILEWMISPSLINI